MTDLHPIQRIWRHLVPLLLGSLVGLTAAGVAGYLVGVNERRPDELTTYGKGFKFGYQAGYHDAERKAERQRQGMEKLQHEHKPIGGR